MSMYKKRHSYKTILCFPLDGEIMGDLFVFWILPLFCTQHVRALVSFKIRRKISQHCYLPSVACMQFVHLTHSYAVPLLLLIYLSVSTDRLETLWGQSQWANPYLLLYLGQIIYYTLSVTGTHLIHKNGYCSFYQGSFSLFFPSTSVPPISKFPSLVHLWVTQVRACVFAQICIYE